MKKLKIIIPILIIGAVVLLFLLRGREEEKIGKAKITLEILNNEDMASPEGRVWEEIKAAFLSAHPDIEIVEETLYGEAYHQKAKARAAAKDLPDVVYLWPGARSSYLYDNELIEDLTPYVDKKEFKPAAMVAQGPNGEIFELPWSITATSILFVNTRILEEVGLKVPETYEELDAMVQPLKKAGYDTIIMPNEPGWVMNSCLFSTFVGRYGGPNWMAEAAAGKHKFTDEPFVKALTMVERLYKDGVLPASSLRTSFGDAPSLFVQKKAPFMIDGIWRATTIKDTPREFKDHIQLKIFPKIPEEKFPDSSSMVPAVGFGMVRGLKGAKKEAALTFIKWVAGYEASKIRLEKRGYVPVYEGNYEPSEDPLMKRAYDFYDTYPNASGVVDNFIGGRVNEKLNNGMQEIGLGMKTPEQVAQEVQAIWEQEKKSK